MSEQINEAIMGSFNKTYDNLVEDCMQKQKEEIIARKQEQPTGAYDIYEEFNNEHDDMDIDQVLDDVIIADQDRPLEPEDVDAVRKYRDFLYKDNINLEDDLDSNMETHQIKDEIYEAMLLDNTDEVLDVISDRRQSSLQNALSTFNKIQNLQFTSLKDRHARDERILGAYDIEQLEDL